VRPCGYTGLTRATLVVFCLLTNFHWGDKVWEGKGPRGTRNREPDPLRPGWGGDAKKGGGGRKGGGSTGKGRVARGHRRALFWRREREVKVAETRSLRKRGRGRAGEEKKGVSNQDALVVVREFENQKEGKGLNATKAAEGGGFEKTWLLETRERSRARWGL